MNTNVHTEPTLAVIMPVKNRLTLTRQTIETLFRTMTKPFKLVIVADDCNEETDAYIASLPDHVTKVFTNRPVGPGKARNMGMDAAGDADYYYHTDCDMYFLDGWYEKMLAVYQEIPQIGVLGGRKHPHHGVHETITYLGKQGATDVLMSDQQVGMSMLFSREVWQKVQQTYGGFKDNGYSPHTMGQEDTAFCLQVQELGYKVGSISPAVVLHCGIKNTFNMDTAGHPEELQQPFPEDCKYGIYD